MTKKQPAMSDMDDDVPDEMDKTSILQSETFKVRLAQAGQAPPAFVLLVGPASSVGRQWPIEDTDRVVGRAESSHVQVDDKSLSKSHAKILLKGGDVSVMDLESTNRTVVNGVLLQPLVPLLLKNNDQIKMGNLIFKFLERGNIETVSAAQTFDRALTDALTGINNKGALAAKGDEYFRRSELLGIPLSLVTFDIDRFKVINDTHGHLAGDHILRDITRVIREKLIRENDFFARSGGEEFCLLVLGAPIKQAEEVSERIRHTIETHDFVYEGTHIPVTISLGVSCAIPGDTGWLDIFHRADTALYESKRGGRNRSTVK